MVKFAIAPVALLAGGTYAQESSASESAASSTAAPTSISSSSSSGGGEAGGASGICTVLVGDPLNQPAGCPYSSTSTPPYDLSSLVSYLIGGYTRGPEGREKEAVANDLAGSVLKYYPTLTAPKSEIQEAIEASITAARNGEITLDAAPHHLPANLLSFGATAAAVVAAGAYIL